MNLRLRIWICLGIVHWRQAELIQYGSEYIRLSCPEHYKLDPTGSKCYRLHTEAKSWMDAEQECNSVRGGHLASFQTQEQLNFLYSFLSDNSLRIGVNDIDAEGRWVFSDGTSYPSSGVDQVNEYNQENEDCAELRPMTDRVADGNCYSQFPYVCIVEALRGALRLNSQNNEDIFGHLIDASINTCVKSREVVMAEILVKFNQVEGNDGDSVILNVLFSDTIKCQERQVLNSPKNARCFYLKSCTLLTTSPSTTCSYKCPCSPPQCTVTMVDTYYGYHRQIADICEIAFGTEI